MSSLSLQLPALPFESKYIEMRGFLLDEIFQWNAFCMSKKLIWPSLTLCLVNPHLWQIFLSPQTKFIWHIKIFISIEYIHNSCLWTYVATIVVFRKVFYKEREEIVQNFYFDRIKVWEKISYFHPNPYKWWNLVWALEYIEFWILRDLVVWQIYIHMYSLDISRFVFMFSKNFLKVI